MFSDIVFPKDNEKKLINKALILGYSKLYLVYDSIKDINKEIINYTDIKLEFVVKNKKNKNFSIFEASEKSRHIIEKIRPDLIYDLEMVGRKDFIHHRNSGLNQVLCKLANKNKVAVGINFNNFLKETNLRKDVIIGRIQQNIRLCRKFKVKMLIGSFASKSYQMRNPKDLLSFLTVLGMHPKEAKDSLNY